MDVVNTIVVVGLAQLKDAAASNGGSMAGGSAFWNSSGGNGGNNGGSDVFRSFSSSEGDANSLNLVSYSLND